MQYAYHKVFQFLLGIYYILYDLIMSIFVNDPKAYSRKGGNTYGGDNKKKYNTLRKGAGNAPAGGGWGPKWAKLYFERNTLEVLANQWTLSLL